MTRRRKAFTAAVSVWLFASGGLCLPVAGRDVNLSLRPQKAPSEIGRWSLLPPEASLIDGDAAPLYEKAVKALPDKAGDKQIRDWLGIPADQLPVEQVEPVLTQYMESLKCVARAVKCRQCNWPVWKPGDQVANLDEYRRIAFAVRLWARLEIAQEGYEGAILALQTGFGMARQHGQAPTIGQVLLATAAGHSLCREVEEFVQGKEAPNLHPALAGLPRPFIDVEKAIESEKKAASSGLTGKLLSRQFESQLKPAHDRSRVIVKRFDSNLAALQCVEAIRSYVAAHNGQLPAMLADITEVTVPKDPMNGEPFHYARTGATATLESFLPPGGSERERVRYEISIRN